MREVIGVDRKGPEIHQDSRIGLALPRSGSVVVAVMNWPTGAVAVKTAAKLA